MGVEASVETETSFQQLNDTDRHRGIVRMNNIVKRRFQSGVDYNMKVIIRGDRATGKSNLFRRLQGMHFQSEHIITPEIAVGTLNWQSHSESNGEGGDVGGIVKVDVWDIVDRAPVFEDQWKLEKDQSNRNKIGPLDASSIDIYRDSHAVIFMVNPFSRDSLDYVEGLIASIPAHIIILIILNFSDLLGKDSSRIKVTFEDISHLLEKFRSNERNIYALKTSLLTGQGLDLVTEFLFLPFYRVQQESLMMKHHLLQLEFERHEQQLILMSTGGTTSHSHLKIPSQNMVTSNTSTSESMPTEDSSTAVLESIDKKVNDRPSESPERKMALKTDVVKSDSIPAKGEKHVQFSHQSFGNHGSGSDSDEDIHVIRSRVLRSREGQRLKAHPEKEFSPMSKVAVRTARSQNNDDDGSLKALHSEPPTQSIKPGLKRVRRKEEKDQKAHPQLDRD